MATSWSIDRYRDPEKIDISVLGKAMQYKQNLYDTNVAQTQQMINQYAGTDLLRDVDKEYFGERLNTLTNYVNQSGTRDWSRKSVANELQNYVSSALDSNVMSAIGSTNVYRKQQADIEDIKKNKPDQYSIQNEWYATKDLQRYLRSGKVGDSYHAQSYTPYTDVKEQILKHSDKLKDFGMELYTNPIGGNSYFTRIGTFEKIDPETAKQYLSTIMDAKVMNQLFIDGQYSYKDTPPEKIKASYDARLNTYTKAYDDRLGELRAVMLTATRDKKAEYQKQIDVLESNKNELNKSKSIELSTSAMSDYLYSSDFKNKWSGFLSFDKLKDWKMEKSGFELQKYLTDLLNSNRNYDLNVDKFKSDEKYRHDKMAQEDAHHLADMTSKGMKSDGTLDPNNPNSGLILTDSVTPQDDKVIPVPFTTFQNKYFADQSKVTTNVAAELEAQLAKPENAEIKKRLGKNSTTQIAFMLLNSPGQHRNLYNLLSANSKGLVDQALSSKQQITDYDTNLKGMSSDIGEWANAVTSSETKSDTKEGIRRAVNGLTLNSEGNVVQGDVIQGNDQFAVAARKIAVINQQLMSGSLSEDDTAKYIRMARNELIGTGMSVKKAQIAAEKLIFQPAKGSWLQKELQTVVGVGLTINPFSRGLLQGAQGIYNALDPNDDGKKATFADDIIKFGSKTFEQNGELGGVKRRLREFDEFNQNLNSIGNSDIDASKLSFKPTELLTRLSTQSKAIDEKLHSGYVNTLSKGMNINTADKDYAKIRGGIMAQLPVGTEIQKDSNLKITIDKESGIANITAAVKNGKEYKATPFSVKISDLPPTILNQIDMSEKNPLYSASNKYSVKYNRETELPRDRDEWSQGIELLPASERSEAYQRRPVTQNDILNRLDMAYGKDIVDKNITAIQKIMDAPTQVSLIPDHGQWTTLVKQGDSELMRQPTGIESYNPDLTEKTLNSIITSAIEERIKSVLGNGTRENINRNGSK